MLSAEIGELRVLLGDRALKQVCWSCVAAETEIQKLKQTAAKLIDFANEVANSLDKLKDRP